VTLRACVRMRERESHPIGLHSTVAAAVGLYMLTLDKMPHPDTHTELSPMGRHGPN